jgi:hypothetical protein
MIENHLQNLPRVVEDLDSFLQKRIKAECPHIPVLENITAEEFEAHYVAKNKPVILRGLINHWPAAQKWSFNFFAENCEDAEVATDLWYLSRTQKTTMRQFIEKMNEVEEGQSAYL